MSGAGSALAPGEGRGSAGPALLPQLVTVVINQGCSAPAWCWWPCVSQLGVLGSPAAWGKALGPAGLGAGGWAGPVQALTELWEPLQTWAGSSAVPGTCQPWLQVVFLPGAPFSLLV